MTQNCRIGKIEIIRKYRKFWFRLEMAELVTKIGMTAIDIPPVDKKQYYDQIITK